MGDLLNLINSNTVSLVVTFSQRVQCVDHQLEDGAAQGCVVEGGRAAASLQDRTNLQVSRRMVGYLNLI